MAKKEPKPSQGKLPDVSSVVVITIRVDKSIRDSATGFVIGQSGNDSYVLTCDHVISQHGERNFKVFVNEVEVTTWESAQEAHGLDLLLLRVSGLGVKPARCDDQEISSSARFVCVSFTPFVRHDFIQSIVDGTLGKPQSIMNVSPGRRRIIWPLEASSKEITFRKGQSGSPVFVGDAVMGIAVLRANDGKLGYAIGIHAAKEIWPSAFVSCDQPGQLEAAVQDGQPEAADRNSPPPNKAPITHRDDPEKGRWGGLNTRDNRRLFIDVHRQNSRYCVFDAVVESTDGSQISGPVVFYLHDTFARSKIWIRNPDEDGKYRLKEVQSWGVFTLGVQVKNAQEKWISLEYDLIDDPGIEKVLKEK